MNNVKIKGLFKKAAAMVLGITMAFGALMLPESAVKTDFPTACADAEIKIGDVTYTYYILNHEYACISGVEYPDTLETLEIPLTITSNGTIYPVSRIDYGFLQYDKTVKTVKFPALLKSIDGFVLSNSAVENIVLPDGLEELGNNFAANCKNLKSVKYNGTGISPEKMGPGIFINSNIDALYNEKGAVCLGNWIIKYKPGEDVSDVKLADIGNNGVKIENIYYNACDTLDHVTSLDLDGVKYIDKENFLQCPKLKTIINDEDIEDVDEHIFETSPWIENAKKNNLAKLGKCLLYYKTDSNEIDFTSGELAYIRNVLDKALVDSRNLDTIYCSQDCVFGEECFYKANQRYYTSGHKTDPLPVDSAYRIKNIYIDGKPITFQSLSEDPQALSWFKANVNHFNGTQIIKDMTEEKTEQLFKQLDITYYGMDNDKIGTLSPTEEYYIRLKIHNYLSIYDYDYEFDNDYVGFVPGYLLGTRLRCTGYAELTHYLLECAGVEAKTFHANEPGNILAQHFWNGTKIGDEWFFNDDGWDAQNNSHDFNNYLKSYTSFATGWSHTFQESYDSFHFYSESRSEKNVTAERCYGDIDGNDKRDAADAEILWDYIKGTSTEIDKKAADINFDDKVDVTDAVLLDRMVNGTALDKDNIPTDGFAPGVQIAVLNGEDYDNIQYLWTERGGYITLPKLDLEAPEGKKLSYDVGMVGQKVRITTPYQVVHVKWIDENTPDYSEPDSTPDDSSTPDKKDGILGDVNNDSAIDIEDAVAIIQHINGVTPLTADEESRADVSRDSNIDIDDAVMIISYINGNSTF